MADLLSGSPNIEEKIKAEAYRLGFSLCGITTPDSISQYSRYQDWLDHGFNAEMQYLATDYHRNARRDPHVLMPSVKSIICLAFPYPLHPLGILSEHDRFLVAGYAAGTDYHLELPKRLNLFQSTIENLCNKQIRYKSFTDSAPILEREFANRAGLGWIGRNSCLINPEIGSAFLLAEVFLDLELTPDIPFEDDRCGSCHRCVDACPTKCINPDQTINSSRCLSYHSIENKNGIPDDIAGKMPPWIFGCDICQMVCPWNKKAQSAEPPISFSSRELVEFLQIPPDDFDLRFRESAIKRTKFYGFMRNIILNLGQVDPVLRQLALDQFIESNGNPDLVNLGMYMKAKLEKKPPL